MKKFKIALLALAVIAGIALAPSSVLADTKSSLCQGADCNSGNPELLPTIRNITNTLLFLGGSISVVVIIIGGIRYATSSGDQAQVTSAKNTVMYALIGLVVIILSYAIVNFVLARL